jgi:hypothetical protein
MALAGPIRTKIGPDLLKLRRDWYPKKGCSWYGNAIPELAEKDQGRLDLPVSDQTIPGQTVQTVLLEIAVPSNAPAGIYNGALAVGVGDMVFKVPVSLKVYNVNIPDELSYIIELNSYGQRDKDRFHATHRMAHYFRTGYNTLSYSHSGNRKLPCIPEIVGEGANARVKSWKEWDEWMSPLLDGTLFADLPRGKTPIPHFYLPFYESYPTEIYEEYLDGKLHDDSFLEPGEKWERDKWRFYMCANDVYVADGFSDKWKAAAKTVAEQYREYFEKKGWTDTQFQIFANCKINFRRGPGSKATSLWTLDEPSFGRDFRALAFLYRTFKEPFRGSKLNVQCRGDVSRPQWQGDRLDGVSDITVVSGALYAFQPLIQRRRVEHDDVFWFYGGSPGVHADLTQIAAIYLKTWTLGCDGGLAYWTSFHGNDWDKADSLAIVLQANHGYKSLAVPTDRLSAQRRVQQDIELLNLLAEKKGWSRRRAARALAAAVNLASETVARGADDPGKTNFAAVRVDDLARIRLALLEMLSE